MNQILIIEDDCDIAKGLQYNFRREGFSPIIAESGEKGLRLALDKKNPFLLILLDLMLPEMSGLELCRRLRREPLTGKTPIIMLTARASQADKIAGLNSGADDFIVKPFSNRELLARVRALLRRVPEFH
jgi:two-component system, OmpR family, phosphate regulon response regulator PhoB